MMDQKAERTLFDPEFCESRCPICTRARKGSRLARIVQRLEALLTVAALLVSAGLARPARAATLPKYDHIVIVFEENKDYGQVIGSSNAPYINNTLLGTYHGVSLTNMYAEQHPSQPNYLAFFSGSNQGVNDNGQHDLPPKTTPNLGASLLAKGYTFKGYAEDLPSVGYTGASHSYISRDDYVLKHCPWPNWQQFGAGIQANSIPANLNVPFCTATNNRGHYPASYYFPTDYSQLPTLSLVIPDEMNDMHSGSILAGDRWLKTCLDGYAQWAITHNSLLIVTWDEDGSTGQAKNQLIPTVLVGANLKAGNYGETINHYNLLRTIEEMYGLPYCTKNDANASPITDVFTAPRPSIAAAGGRPVKSLPPHLIESGIPTESEIALVDGWLKAVAAGQQGGPPAQAWFDHWIGAGLPFSFRYAGKDFTGADGAWQFHVSDVRRQADVETQDWTWLHAQTGLKATWRIKRFLDYPAVDTLLTFENTGSKNTALIEGVRNLDLKLKHAQAGKGYTVHGAHGGRCGADDFMPFTRTVVAASSSARVGSGVTKFGSAGSSSNEELPFLNIETPENRGVLVGLGWTGVWQAEFTASGTQLEAKAGMTTTKFLLHPGERVRGPRVLLVLLGRQAFPRPQHAPPRALRALPAAAARREAAPAAGLRQYLLHLPRRRLLSGESHRADPFGAGPAVHRTGGRGLRDRRGILQLRETELVVSHQLARLLAGQDAVSPRLRPDSQALGQGGHLLRLVVPARVFRLHEGSQGQGNCPGDR